MIGASLALIVVLGVQLWGRYASTSASLAEVVDRLEPAATNTNELVSAINNMDRRLRIYVSGGAGGYRPLYKRAVAESEEALAGLDSLMGSDPDYRVLISDAERSREEWLAVVGDPAMSAMANDEQDVAADIVDSDSANASFARMIADTYRLSVLITADQHAELAQSAEQSKLLARVLAVALFLMFLVPIASYVALRRWVLKPVESLGLALRRAAGDVGHKTVIEASGPPELHQLGTDAEALRRNLVRQIDQATAAQDALAQEGPVVSAIRAELQARTDARPIGVAVAGVLRPAEGVVAGDFWDRIPLGDGRTAVVICDISGHGPRAGIVALRIKTAITMGLLAGNDPTTIFHRACDSFSDEPARFATAVIMTVDPGSGELTWVNAGHPEPRLLRAGGQVERLETTGPMLSWLGGAWRTGSTVLGPADVALGFTDGVLESRGEDGSELGDDGLDQRLLAAAAATSDPEELLARALAGVRQRAQDLSRDDVTMIALRLDPQRPAIPAPRR